jgi:hypothetical protein
VVRLLEFVLRGVELPLELHDVLPAGRQFTPQDGEFGTFAPAHLHRLSDRAMPRQRKSAQGDGAGPFVGPCRPLPSGTGCGYAPAGLAGR